MSPDEQRLSEALTTYAEGAVVTTSDVDRMQRELNHRIGSRNWAPRRRLVLAAAAVLLLIVAAAAGTLWLRRPAPTVPADPQGLGPMPAINLNVDATGFSNLIAARPDHTMTGFDTARALIHPVPGGGTLGWRVDGNIMINDAVDSQGRACRATGPWRAESDGLIVYDTAALEGPGCTNTSLPAATSTRLSPASVAGTKLTENGSDITLPVSDPVQLNGVWLLRGTGLLLASDEVTNNGADYLLDDDGDIDRAPDAQGQLAVGTDGLVTLTSPSCGDTKLGHPVLHGTSIRSSLTLTVEDDPCNRFGGNTVLTWIRVL
jgi:hypothetical protein